MRVLHHQLLLLGYRLCDSSSSGASRLLGAAPAAMQALAAWTVLPTHAHHSRAGQQRAPCNPSAEAAARLAAHQQHSRAPAQYAGSWHTSSPLPLVLRHHARSRAAAAQCSTAGPRTRKAQRQLHSSTAGQAAAPAGVEAELEVDSILQHAMQHGRERGYQQQLHSQAAGEAVPGLALAQHISPIMLAHGGEPQTQHGQQQQQEQEQQVPQHSHAQAGARLSQQQLRSLPQEVLLVGIDPDCSGAIAVVRSPLRWSLTPAAPSNGSSTSSKRTRAKKPTGGISSGDGSSVPSSSSSNSSSNDSNSGSSSTAEVLQLQAYMGLPAVRVYDMPVETIVTKIKTSTGKRRVRRRLDIMQAMAIVRQVLQDAAEEADPVASSTAGTTDTVLAATATTAAQDSCTTLVMHPSCSSAPGTSSSTANSAPGDTSSSSSSDTSSSSAADAAVPTTSSRSSSHTNDHSSRDGSIDTAGPTSLGSNNGGSSSGKAGSIDAADPISSLGSSSHTTSSRGGNGSILLRAVVEVASLMPTNGSLATLNQGYSVGAWTALLASHGFDVTTVHVMSWKKNMGLLKQDKDCSRALARELFRKAQASQDHLLMNKNTHGRAEALLLAAWGLGWSASDCAPDWAPRAALMPIPGPLRATVHMDGGQHSLPLQHQQQPPRDSSTSPAGAAAAASGVMSDDEQVLCSQLGLLDAAAAGSFSMPGVVTRRHIAQRLQPYADPGRPFPPPPPRILDVGAQQEAVAAAAAAAQAAKVAEKEQRAAARKQAAADRAAAKAREKEEREAARVAKAAARQAARQTAQVRKAEGGEAAGGAAAKEPARRRRRSGSTVEPHTPPGCS